MRKIFNVAALACLVLATITATACSAKKSGAVTYEFTNVRRGTIERTISASGTLSPVSTIKVLPQMSGKVERIYVDYNDQVHKGDILAELNTDMLKLKREQQYAAVIKARANYELQMVNYRNQEALANKNLISEYELKTSKTNLDNQAADLAVAEANLKSIDTEINQFAYITSPIDGIVLDRKINIGDTVSDNGSSYIFMLAENLREMQIEAQVGELDITSLQKGQPVRFTLESLPGQTFNGVVETLRMVPVVSSNVVSYTVIVRVGNSRGNLFSGMTCAVDFIVENSENTLIVSNAALRYQPNSLSAETIAEMVFNASLENMSEEQRMAAMVSREQPRAQNVSQSPNTTGNNAGNNAGAGLTSVLMGGGAGGRAPGGFGGGQFTAGGGRQGQGQGQGQGRNAAAPAVVMRNLWYVNNEGKLEVMQVRTGISSGSYTEIYAADDLEGKQIILREKI
jgi:HlyD family secretion protein